MEIPSNRVCQGGREKFLTYVGWLEKPVFVFCFENRANETTKDLPQMSLKDKASSRGQLRSALPTAGVYNEKEQI